jgi:hypothetical protein
MGVRAGLVRSSGSLKWRAAAMNSPRCITSMAQVAASQETPPEDYLLGTPLLAEHLEAGLDKLGISCVDLAPGGPSP